MASLRPRDALLLAAVAALWGFNFVPIRWALDAVPPFALAATRFTLAAFPAILFVRPPQGPVRWLVAYGLFIGVGQFGLLFLAIRLGLHAGLASLLMQVQVFFTMGLAAVALRDRISPAHVLGAAVAALGIAALGAQTEDATALPVGLLVLVLGAAGSWAVGNVVAKHASRRHGADPFALVVWSSLVPPIPLALLSFFTEGGTAPLRALLDAGALAWASIAFMAFGATLWGFAAWNRMLHRYPAGAVTPFALLIPVAGLVSAWLLLREPMSARELAAAGIVLIGLALAILWPVRPRASS